MRPENPFPSPDVHAWHGFAMAPRTCFSGGTLAENGEHGGANLLERERL
jgi:hypothetical protein